MHQEDLETTYCWLTTHFGEGCTQIKRFLKASSSLATFRSRSITSREVAIVFRPHLVRALLARCCLLLGWLRLGTPSTCGPPHAILLRLQYSGQFCVCILCVLALTLFLLWWLCRDSYLITVLHVTTAVAVCFSLRRWVGRVRSHMRKNWRCSIGRTRRNGIESFFDEELDRSLGNWKLA